MAVGVPLQFEWANFVRLLFSPLGRFITSLLILLAGSLLGYLAWLYTRRFLRNLGVPEAVEGTPFERTARSLGTSTIGIVSNLSALFVYVAAIILALNVSQILATAVFWSRVTNFLPNLFVAVFALIFGLIAGDKARLVVSERLRSVKVPQVGLLPELVKYSIFYLAALVALGQLGIAIQALLILLAAYAFGIVLLAAVAFKQLLSAAAAGLYLVLTQPYAIGDEVEIDGHRGVVQEVGLFVTNVEGEEKEQIIPNNRVFASGIVRYRE